MVLWNDSELGDDDRNQLHQQAAYEQKNGKENGCHAYCAATKAGLASLILVCMCLAVRVGKLDWVGSKWYISNGLVVTVINLTGK